MFVNYNSDVRDKNWKYNNIEYKGEVIRFMKKVLSLVLVLVLSFSMVTGSFAAENNRLSIDEEKKAVFNRNDYNKHEMSFQSIASIKDTLKTKMPKEAKIKIAELGEKNIKEIKKQIIDLNLSAKGYNDLQKHLFDNLEKIVETGGYIDSYTIYIPKPMLNNEVESSRSGSYYGTYNSFNFKDVFVEFSDSYYKFPNESQIEKWARAAVDLALSFGPASISRAFTILSAATQENIRTYSVKESILTASDSVTEHYISIQDAYCYVGNDPNYYTTVIIDEYRINTTEMITMYDDSNVLNDNDVISYNEHVICSTWSDSKSSQMRRGYNKYVSSGGRDVSQNLVGRFSVDWE